MSDIALRPRSSTELVDAAFQLYRREPLQFIAGLALIYVPWLVIAALAGVELGFRGTTTIGDSPNTSLFYSLLVSLCGILVTTIAGGVVSVMASDVYFGRSADIGKAFRAVGSNFWTLLAALICYGALIFLGLMLLLVPALYVGARFFALKQIILLEDAGFSKAFSRTSFLTMGNKRHVLNTLGLVVLLNLAVTGGTALFGTMIPSEVIRLLLQTCAAVLVYPLVGITETLLYYDIRIRREGFDIEYLAAAASAPQPAEQPATT